MPGLIGRDPAGPTGEEALHASRDGEKVDCLSQFSTCTAGDMNLCELSRRSTIGFRLEPT
jgi:hypothetical protein